MPFGGRGYRNWFYATGLPGWMRAAQGLPAYSRGFANYRANSDTAAGTSFRGNPYWNCRFFPWLPRGWWSGAFGTIQWTSQGPKLVAQASKETQTTQSQEQELQALEQQMSAIEEEKKALEQDLEQIKERIKELKKQSS